MGREINKTKANGAAWRLTQDYCLDTPGPTPVEDIAMDHGVLCLEANLTGCLARLVRKGNRGVIRTKASIREAGRKRFAIAHELGHWFLHANESQVFICTAEQMRDYKGSPTEVEANIFASELLLPTFLFGPLADKAAPSLESIRDLSHTFVTSLTATGMKFVDLNRHECVLVMSTGGKVVWSKQKGNRSGLRIEKGLALHESSLARHVVEPKGEAGPAAVDPEAWIKENWFERKIELTEQSWTLDGYDSVLTLLTIVDADEDPSEDMVGHYERKARGTQ